MENQSLFAYPPGMLEALEAIQQRDALRPRTNSWGPYTRGTSWNNRLNRDPDNTGKIVRKIEVNPLNGRNRNKDSVVTPLDMYLGLLYPSCPVGIDAATRKKLRDYATRMKNKQPIFKTQRERMEALLKRLVHAGDKCGFATKEQGKKYRLPTKQEMTNLGYVAQGVSGKFFYKRPRKPHPTPNPRKGPKKPRGSVNVFRYVTNVKSPAKRVNRRMITNQGYNLTGKTNNQVSQLSEIAGKKKFIRTMVSQLYHMDLSLVGLPDEYVYKIWQQAMTGNYSFLSEFSMPT